jgi:(1->4)-alpha-D-glucan 1-alpha-D-glucosylmutase
MRIPSATYRLQLNKDFRFEDARRIVSYLHDLGVSDLYVSPIFKAGPGSTHGYDVVDPGTLNPEIGSSEEFEELIRELRRLGMGLVVDIVPNHMAVSPDNPWWHDILTNGRNSRYADYFDIDWCPSSGVVRDKVLLPVLRTSYSQALEGRHFRLRLEEQGFFIHYYESKFPLKVDSYRLILDPRLGLPDQSPQVPPALPQPVSEFLSELDGLPAPSEACRSLSPEAALDRDNAQEAFKNRLWHSFSEDPATRDYIDQRMQLHNGRKGDYRSFDWMDRLLSKQAYHLAFWRTAVENINYRRFFNITDLISLRMEERQVFQAHHSLLFQLVKEGKITGLRVDHIDGLHDPLEYLRRIHAALSELPPSLESTCKGSVYVVVEKILSGSEPLPEEWPACGTTGYDYLNVLNGLFVDHQELEQLNRVYVDFTGSKPKFEDVAYENKKEIIRRQFSSELSNLQHDLNRIANQDRYGRDISRRELERALYEVTACLPVYRTYTRGFHVSEQDREAVSVAVSEARRRTPLLAGNALRFLGRLLTLDFSSSLGEEQKERWLAFVMRWQQFTGPITAKGVEDTALYLYNRLLSTNEVGSEPSEASVRVDGFHHYNESRQRLWPHTMNATSTHDTKRGEDLRARLNVLSEMPEAWESRLKQWSGWNTSKRRQVDGRTVPVPNEEILIYQTLLGAWPLQPEEVDGLGDRLSVFIEKALREAKTYTRWTRPNEAHEQAVKDFTREILEASDSNQFLRDFLAFQKELAFYGAVNALSQLVLKLTSPGLPDLYQATELWNLSLVDPDNRRPVDFERNRQQLEGIRSRLADRRAVAAELLHDWQTGDIKLYLTSECLGLRRRLFQVFATGDYQAVPTQGEKEECLCAFTRQHEGSWTLTAVPRMVTRLGPVGRFPLGQAAWKDEVFLLPGGSPDRWENLFTGEALEAEARKDGRVLLAARVFEHLPVALLTAQS